MGEGEGDGDGDGDGDGVGDGLGDGDGEGLGDGDGDGDGEGVGDGLGDGLGEPEGDGVGDGEGKDEPSGAVGCGVTTLGGGAIQVRGDEGTVEVLPPDGCACWLDESRATTVWRRCQKFALATIVPTTTSVTALAANGFFGGMFR